MNSIFAPGAGKLGFGIMRMPETDGRVDRERAREMIDAFLAAGYTYFDTAYGYHDGDSERVLGELLVARYPRESFTLADKMPLYLMDASSDPAAYFEEQKKRACVDYFDYYLLHAVNSRYMEMTDQLGLWEFCRQRKAAGEIRHFGFSFHDTAEALDGILTRHPETEFVQLQLNYFDWDNEKVQARQCYEVAQKHGKPVIVMEPVRGGALARLSGEAAALLAGANPACSAAAYALRFAASLDGVAVVLSGMSDLSQVGENAAVLAGDAALTDAERAAVGRVAELLHAVPTIPCTACRYCVEGCPVKINIPQVLRILNDHRRFRDGEQAGRRLLDAANEAGSPAACIGCGVCAARCPQHIEIPACMQEAAALL